MSHGLATANVPRCVLKLLGNRCWGLLFGLLLIVYSVSIAIDPSSQSIDLFGILLSLEVVRSPVVSIHCL
mgnify:FL=1